MNRLLFALVFLWQKGGDIKMKNEIVRVRKLVREAFNALYNLLRYEKLDPETRGKIEKEKKRIGKVHNRLEEIEEDLK